MSCCFFLIRTVLCRSYRTQMGSQSCLPAATTLPLVFEFRSGPRGPFKIQIRQKVKRTLQTRWSKSCPTVRRLFPDFYFHPVRQTTRSQRTGSRGRFHSHQVTCSKTKPPAAAVEAGASLNQQRLTLSPGFPWNHKERTAAAAALEVAKGNGKMSAVHSGDE